MISGPPARWTAPSTPPPPASELLAALTMASTSRVVMSALRSVIRPRPKARPSGPWGVCTGLAPRVSATVAAAEPQAHVVTAKAERCAQRKVDAGLAAVVRHVIEVAVGVRLVEVDRRRR